MKITDVINRLKDIKVRYGDLEVCHYNNMDYWKYPLEAKNIEVVKVKNHPDGCKVYCNPDDKWTSEQNEFDKQYSFNVVSI